MGLKLTPFLQTHLPRGINPVQSPTEVTGAPHESGHLSGGRELRVGDLCPLHEFSLAKQGTKHFKVDVAQFLFHNVTFFEFTW